MHTQYASSRSVVQSCVLVDKPLENSHLEDREVDGSNINMDCSG
jgi:hypothetical protein